MAIVPPPVIRLYILGGFRAERAGEPIPDTAWRLRSARGLIKILAAHVDHALHREELQEALWPDFEAGAAYNSFRKALHLARHALQPDLEPKATSAYLQSADDVVSLVGNAVWIDADQFEVEARTAIECADIPGAERAIALYGGDLLTEDRYAEWAETRRDELARLRLTLLLSQAESLENRGSYTRAMEPLHQVLAVDPSHERAHRNLIRLQALSGNRYDAIKQYRVYRDTLQRELSVDPDTQTEALYRSIVAGETGPPASDPKTEKRVGIPLPARVQRFLAGPFIDRLAATEMLTSQLRKAHKGEGHMVLVSGEAGTGKSRLIAELAKQAQQQGVIVLWGASYQEEGLLPYGALVEVLDAQLSLRPEDERRDLAVRYPDVAVLLPCLVASASAIGRPVGGETERTRLFAAVVSLLDEIAVQRPLLLVLDDLQCADPGTLRLLHYLARSLEQRPWLIVGSYREEDVEPDSPLRAFVRTTSQNGLSQHIELLRLGRHDADAFIQSLLGNSTVDRALLDKLYALSIGNPLFLQQLLAAMHEAGSISYVDGAWREDLTDIAVIPPRVRELIDLRVQRLGDDTRAALCLIAVIGMDASEQVLQESSQLGESRLLNALDAAVASRFVDEAEGRYTFRHPLFREVLYDLPSQARRTATHRSVAMALQKVRPRDVEALAYHFKRGGLIEPALRYLELAGDRAASIFAHDVALTYYQEALGLILPDDEPVKAAVLLGKMGELMVTGGHYDEALLHLEQAVLLYSSLNDLEGLGTVTAQIGYVHALRGSPQEGADRIRSMVEDLDSGRPSAAQAWLSIQLSQLEHFSNRYTHALKSAERAVTIASAIGDQRLRVEADNVSGLALMLLGRFEEAVAIFRTALPVAAATGAEATLADLHGRLGLSFLCMGAFEDSANHARLAVGQAEKRGDPVRKAIWGTVLGLHSLFAGDWVRARAQLDECIAVNRRLGDHNLSAYPLFGLAWLMVAEGDWRGAEDVLRQGFDLTKRYNNLQAGRWTARVLSELYLLQGRPQDAMTVLGPLGDRPGLEEADVTLFLPCLAWAHHALGRPREATKTIKESIDRSRRQSLVISEVDSLTLYGMILGSEGNTEKAEAEFDAAVAVARNIRYPLAEARAHASWGKMLAETGKIGHGLEHLEEAQRVFHALGARRFEASTHETLQHLRDAVSA